jgi:hypothetical protein
MLDHLNPEMIEFVGRMEMAFIGTADAGGECDSTFRAGPPGFLHVLDPERIAYPEYRGNGVLASLGNISENPHVAVLMIDFVRDLIGLHVNGRASIIDDGELRRAQPPTSAAGPPSAGSWCRWWRLTSTAASTSLGWSRLPANATGAPTTPAPRVAITSTFARGRTRRSPVPTEGYLSPGWR